MVVDDKKAVSRTRRWVAVLAALLSSSGVSAALAGTSTTAPVTLPPERAVRANPLLSFAAPPLDETSHLSLVSPFADHTADAPAPLSIQPHATDDEAASPSLTSLDRPLTLSDDQDQSETDRIHLSFRGQFIWSPVAGYIQTPLGGGRHTASPHRPRLGELGIHSVSIPDLELGVHYGPHELFAGVQLIRMAERGSNDGTLFNHGVGFPSGTFLKSDLKLDWYRIGYRYDMPLFPADNGVPEVTLTPQINGVYWDFSSRISGGKRKATRAYSTGNFQVGLGGEWRPGGGPFSLDAVGMIAPPIGSLPEIIYGQISAKYRFVETPDLDVTGHVGVGAERIDYHDDQHFQSNHIRADFGPMFTAGVELRF